VDAPGIDITVICAEAGDTPTRSCELVHETTLADPLGNLGTALVNFDHFAELTTGIRQLVPRTFSSFLVSYLGPGAKLHPVEWRCIVRLDHRYLTHKMQLFCSCNS
jgi:hypothetical protein